MAGGGVVVAGIVGVPALLLALTPAWRGRRGERWRRVGRLDDFPIDTVQKAVVDVGRGDWARSVDQKAVYIWRRTGDDVVVYSRNCTDLSCPVTFDAKSECFFCPCHGGIFAKDGRPLAGPPSRPLYRFAYRIRNAAIEIDLNSLPAMA
jgi:menaquinol-cytochrome c reductase iron-sulfur subunit